MNTISLISSISYNTPEFFEEKIKSLCGEKSVLDWCHWIVHQPETDERKSHIHFVCKPSRRVDTQILRKEFIEPVNPLELEMRSKNGEEITQDDLKPLGVLPFDKTKAVSDWLLYAVHDEGYLFQKGQSRSLRYNKSDVQSTDPEYLKEQWNEATNPLVRLCERIVELKAQELSFGQILSTGIIPPNLVLMSRSVYYETPGTTDRNGRTGHDEAVN